MKENLNTSAPNVNTGNSIPVNETDPSWLNASIALYDPERGDICIYPFTFFDPVDPIKVARGYIRDGYLRNTGSTFEGATLLEWLTPFGGKQ